LRLDVLLSDRADAGMYALFVVFSLFSPKVRKSPFSLAKNTGEQAVVQAERWNALPGAR
jgi:hypothetical protein